MINDEAMHLIKRNEGCVLHAYQDVVGVWTIGYGHTEGVTPGMRITQEQADTMFKDDIEEFADGVDAVIEEDYTDNQFGAMVSLAYNVGLGNFKKSSVLRLHNQGDFQGAADAFLKWNKAGGRVLAGLDRRRHEERALYLKA